MPLLQSGFASPPPVPQKGLESAGPFVQALPDAETPEKQFAAVAKSPIIHITPPGSVPEAAVPSPQYWEAVEDKLLNFGF